MQTSQPSKLLFSSFYKACKHFYQRNKRSLSGTLLLFFLSACATRPALMPYRVDHTFVSENQDSRAKNLVLHYTAAPLDKSVKALSEKPFGVSAHYLVPDQPNGPGTLFSVYQLVPEQRRAWHAGISFWRGERLLNSGSIGIETINLGFPPEDGNKPLMLRRWYPYPEPQFQVIGALAKELAARHQIAPEKIVGHSDVAPQRKTDPGPLFPWEGLYREFGVGAWPDEDTVAFYRDHFPYDGNIASLQAKLAAYGYEVEQNGLFDAATQKVVAAFQMHFRPAQYDGIPDVETVARLDALLEKYLQRPRPSPAAPQQPPLAAAK